MPQPSPSPPLRALALAAAAYAFLKVVLAARGEVGMPGFPPTTHAPADQIALRQFGNAAFGLVAALFLALFATPWPQRLPRLLTVPLLWVGGLLIAAGASGLALRALHLVGPLGLTAALGAPPNHPSGTVVALGGVLWAALWLALAWRYTRGR